MHVRKDGSNFPVEASLSYINNGDEYMIAVVRDITNQLKMEEKIKQKAQELERLQKVISKTVLYTTTDLDGNITSVSKAFEELSGYKESELIGKKHSLFKNPNTPKEFYKGMWEVLNSDEQFIGEIKNYTKEKSDYWIKLTIDPLFDEDGKKIGYSSYRENITDKKELAKKDQIIKNQEKLRAIGELLENIAHHWRQPLSVITSTASAMQVSKEFGTLTDESFNNSCNMINNNAQNLSKTIDNFKSFFITDTNKEIFNLKDTIDNYIDLVHTSFEDKNIKIISNIDNIEIDGIKNDFIQILSILFNNSKYALENNEVDNKLIIVDLNKVNDHIVFSVKDNAGGIEEKNINKIFEPYFTTKHAYSGTGLGLYMAHEIVNNSLNGNISAKNLSFESNGYKCFGMQVLIVI